MVAPHIFIKKIWISLSATISPGYVLAALILLYLPTFIDLFQTLWKTDQNAHGPIVFAVACWLLYYKMRSIEESCVVVSPSPLLGWPLFGFGILLFVLGRSQEVLLLEVSSLIIINIAIVLIFFGTKVAKYLWFAFFFMLFMIPIPGSIVDLLTQPMKIAVSFVSENLLFFLNYPVARSGVIITIGKYQLLVADACAGLNSLFTLEALGLLYLNIMRHESTLRNLVLAGLIIPISFLSNVIRVVVLVLITFYLGDGAGQGFIHGFAGLVLFITALSMIIAGDALLRKIDRFGLVSARIRARFA